MLPLIYCIRQKNSISFLELNPVGQLGWLEEPTGLPLFQTLAFFSGRKSMRMGAQSVRDEKLTTLYNHRLVTAIEETRKQLLHPSVQEAFLQVPRHLFVDAYYQGNEYVSTPVAHDEESWHHWLAQVYRDKPLVTQRDEREMPRTTSSSQPSVMAGMLEVLDLHTGQTVLEIGTGTGYNAALVAKLLGILIW